MFTTMKCDFLETKYYYATQQSSQGESEYLDTLNWLRYVACGDERGHSITDESHLSTQPKDHANVIQTAPNLIPKEQEMVFNQKDTPLELNEHVKEQKKSSTQEETSERYVLPPRANREVPQKRYSPEKVSRGSRYPMANIAKGNLSKDAKAFVGKLITCLIIYVDDMIVTGDDKEEITKLKKYLFTEFKMKDLGRLKYFLRIEVLGLKQGIFMCQKRNCPKEIASRKERVPETYDYRSQYDAYECDTYHANYNIKMEDDTMYRGEYGDQYFHPSSYETPSFFNQPQRPTQDYYCQAHEASFVALETHVDRLLKQLNRDETYKPQGITKLDFDDEDKDEGGEQNE
nr:putative ribonuclease H-like domain-containing protein [Tanacetum cinerariifolium]